VLSSWFYLKAALLLRVKLHRRDNRESFCLFFLGFTWSEWVVLFEGSMKWVRGAIWRKYEVSSWCYLKEVWSEFVVLFEGCMKWVRGAIWRKCRFHHSNYTGATIVSLFCFGALFQFYFNISLFYLKEVPLPPFILHRKYPHPPGGSSFSPPMGGSSIWPNKEPEGRRTPSMHLVQILWWRSSSSGPLWGNLPNMRPPRGGLFSAIKLHRHHNRESVCLFFCLHFFHFFSFFFPLLEGSTESTNWPTLVQQSWAYSQNKILWICVLHTD